MAIDARAGEHANGEHGDPKEVVPRGEVQEGGHGDDVLRHVGALHTAPHVPACGARMRMRMRVRTAG